MKANQRNFIRRLKKRKEDALEYTVEHYLSVVKMIVEKSLQSWRNTGLVEECINDVFLAVWQYSDQFEGYHENAQALNLSVDSNGSVITLNEAVYDGDLLTVSFKIKTTEKLSDWVTAEPFFINGQQVGFVRR